MKFYVHKKHTHTHKTLFLSIQFCLCVCFVNFISDIAVHEKGQFSAGDVEEVRKTNWYEEPVKKKIMIQLKQMLFAADNYHSKGSHMEGRHMYKLTSSWSWQCL